MKKIFVTVGTQIPFDRLILAIERWANDHPGNEIFAQIGESKLHPQGIEAHQFIEIAEYQRRVEWCDLIVAHAGIGAILSALEAAKPILIVPRRASLKEHRNDHQLATAERFSGMGTVYVAMTESDVPVRLGEIRNAHQSESLIGHHASPELIDTVRKFLFDES